MTHTVTQWQTQAAVKDRLEQLQELDARREAILSSIEKQGKLTVELMSAIVSAETLAQLEDMVANGRVQVDGPLSIGAAFTLIADR